jgi:hypothetical protein
MGDDVDLVGELATVKQSILSFVAIYGLVIGVASCNSSSSNAPAPIAPVVSTAGYRQVERLARPAIKEATETFANHSITNTVSPESATTDSVLAQSIVSFAETVAGRSAATATTLQAVLIPDEMAADLSDTSDTKAAYLGVETGGFTGSKFGGRALQDDVVSLDLGAVFGPTLSALGVVADDGKESPCLETDNVSAAVAQATDHITPTTFPYVGSPH